MNPKCWIEGLRECGVERVQVGECVRGDAVEGQSACRPVQVHSYSSGAGGRYVSHVLIVPGKVSVTTAIHTPGFVIISKPAVITPLLFPLDAFVCHCYHSTSTTPLRLPVAASRQTLPTQHLIPVVKSLWVVRIRLLLLTHTCHLSVPLREREFSACCVGVQCELTGICRQEERREERTASSEYIIISCS